MKYITVQYMMIFPVMIKTPPALLIIVNLFQSLCIQYLTSQGSNFVQQVPSRTLSALVIRHPFFLSSAFAKSLLFQFDVENQNHLLNVKKWFFFFLRKPPNTELTLA